VASYAVEDGEEEGDELGNLVVTLHDGAGLIRAYTHYGLGDAAPGYPQYEMVRHGRLGDDIRLREYLYTVRDTVDNVTVVKPWRLSRFAKSLPIFGVKGVG